MSEGHPRPGRLGASWPLAAVVVAMLAASCKSRPETQRSSSGPEPVVQKAEAASATTWGPEKDGLRLRAEAPARVARGDDLPCDLRVLVDRRVTAAVPTVDVRHPAYFSRVRLTPKDGGDAVVVVPTDPSAGMPDLFPPDEPLERSVLESPSATEGSLGTVEFPLASQWDRITVGRWRGVVEFVLEGTVGSREVAGSWHGTLVSQEFEFDVTAAPERWLEVKAPAALFGGEADVHMRFPVRNGFAVGLVWRGPLDDGTLGGDEGGLPGPGMFDGTLARIAASKAPATFTIFETSYLPEHFWHPGPGVGHYRVLWSR